MVSNSSSFIFLALLSTALALPQPTKEPVASKNGSDVAYVRPWFLRDLSSHIVDGAIAIRSAGVSEEEASAVAHTLVESGLAHPQYTSIAQDVVDMLVNDGIYVNATSLYNIATEAQSAYDEIHTEPAYSNYIQYARAHATLYDFGKLAPEVPPRLSGIASERAHEQRAAFTSIYASLSADPSGHAALDSLNNVADEYIHDFSKSNTASVNVSMVESVLTYLLN